MVQQGFAEEISLVAPVLEVVLPSTRLVILKGAASTKCRIVGNASQANQKDKSQTLNKLLMPGPNIPKNYPTHYVLYDV